MQANTSTTSPDPLITKNGDQTANLLVRLAQLEQENAALKLALQSHDEEHDCHRIFFQQVLIPCMIITPNGEVKHANSLAANLLATTPASVAGQSLLTFIFEDQIAFTKKLTDLINSGGSSTCELKFMRADRELVLLHLSLFVLQAGDFQSCIGVQLTDVTRQQSNLMDKPEGVYFASVVAENIPGMVAYWNSDLICTYANHHYLTWFGRTSEQMQGIHMRDLLGPELFSKNFAYIRAVLTGVDQHFERTLIKANGDTGYTWAQYIAHKVDGVVRGFFVLVTDISLQKQTQKALMESEAKNRALVRAIPDLILTIHRDGRHLDVHAPDPGMLLIDRKQLLQSKVADVLPAKVADQYMKAITQALDSGRLQEFRHELTVAGRDDMQFEARVVPCTQDAVIAIIRDITETERERRVHELQLSERLQVRENDVRAIQLSLAMASDITHIGTWIRDLRTDDLWASLEWRRLFGFSQDEALKMDMVAQRIHPADRRHIDNIVGDYGHANAERYQAEFRVLLPDESERWVAVVWQLEVDEQKKPLLTRGVTVDISARKEAELELGQKRMEVMHLARVATMGELSGALAHELNQPLTAILSNAQAAQRFLARPEPDIKELGDILQDIVDEDKRAGEIIRRLRKLFDKRTQEQRNVDINQLILEVLHILRNDMINQDITLLSELQDNLPAVRADTVQLQQVLINLIMNASEVVSGLDASRRMIEINTRLTPEEQVEVSVNDHGPGVPDALRTKIFEAFYTTKSNGMGLGLSICKNIIEAAGGQLWCENHGVHAGTGASFRFHLPVNKESAP
ncbi:PAS domain S-box protein [Undibacterium sp. TS12]|uniref:PAS domain-containing sensor histidine kinase n=1 Tax=Undibacterium sp. TS12 TaxID=2908202 RepID=UPI001F4CAE83|nr:PAS domain S-box protein [Undibacterium sp. TS12]MCH8622327.1 PAS domain S-box protein [Undibacterium sp. TS12]